MNTTLSSRHPRSDLARTVSWLATLALVLALHADARAATIRVHYDTGWGKSISIRGSASPLSWTSGKAATWTTGNVWVYTTPSASGGFQFKPLINDATWSVGGNYVVPTGTSTVDIYPFFGNQGGSLTSSTSFYSQRLGNSRPIVVYRPPSYNENAAKRYPVLYMHDGQNLFNASTAFGGVEWQVDETATALMRQGVMREVIIVGIGNTGARISEYTPMPDPSYGGGNGDTYLDFIELELMPYINANYRTRTGPANTTIGGSSLGGLISFYAGWTRSDVFGASICMSSSFWWNGEALTADVSSHTGPLIPFVAYVDAGGINDGAADTADMRNALAGLGYAFNVNLFHWYEPQGSHSEASWRARLHVPFERILPFDGVQ